MIIIQTDKQTIFDFPSQITTAVTSTYQLYYKPPLTFLHFPLKSFQTFYSLVRLVLNWPRQPNSAAIRILRFVNPFNLRKSTYHSFLSLLNHFKVFFTNLGSNWNTFAILYEQAFKRQIFDCAMYGQNFDRKQDRADFGHPTFSNAYNGQIWTLTCVLCMWSNLETVWLQLL